MYPVMFGTGKPDQDKFDKLKEVLGWVDSFVAGDKFCAGTSHITVADIAFLSTFSTFKVRKKEDHGCKHSNIHLYYRLGTSVEWTSRPIPTSCLGLTSVSN